MIAAASEESFSYKGHKVYSENNAFSCGSKKNLISIKENQEDFILCKAEIEGLADNKTCTLVDKDLPFSVKDCILRTKGELDASKRSRYELKIRFVVNIEEISNIIDHKLIVIVTKDKQTTKDKDLTLAKENLREILYNNKADNHLSLFAEESRTEIICQVGINENNLWDSGLRLKNFSNSWNKIFVTDELSDNFTYKIRLLVDDNRDIPEVVDCYQGLKFAGDKLCYQEYGLPCLLDFREQADLVIKIEQIYKYFDIDKSMVPIPILLSEYYLKSLSSQIKGVELTTAPE